MVDALPMEKNMPAINASFVNDIRVPVSEKQYRAGSDIIDNFKFKGLPGNYELEQYA